jgi:hypothetical protein
MQATANSLNPKNVRAADLAPTTRKQFIQIYENHTSILDQWQRPNWPRDSLRGELHTKTQQQPQAIVATPISAEKLSQLPSFLRELLDNCPACGQGLQQWIFRAERHLHARFDQNAIFALIKTRVAGCGPSVLALVPGSRRILPSLRVLEPVCSTGILARERGEQ